MIGMLVGVLALRAFFPVFVYNRGLHILCTIFRFCGRFKIGDSWIYFKIEAL